jgi:hypothetical protein
MAVVLSYVNGKGADAPAGRGFVRGRSSVPEETAEQLKRRRRSRRASGGTGRRRRKSNGRAIGVAIIVYAGVATTVP